LQGRIRSRVPLSLGLLIGGETPVFELELDSRFERAEAPARRAQLDYALDGLGVSEPQRLWLCNVFGSLTSRPMSVTPLAIRLTSEGVLSELRITLVRVPARTVLQMMEQMRPSDDNARRLGVLSALLGETRDQVHRLTLIGWDGEPPQAAFGFQRRG